ncbi:hypothetical protein [Pseudomonas aeruginosa]|uniref:hypothetical protein n=1 Tax=Pseudomonas aeruginosa TaxID=287 RepID=UPI001F4A330D|nr:hypothetical protein [Pseudomonas aeruginosa]HEK0085360.1 hypothetical protein [Pseudomonas aeruginosa]HEK0091537.1 hypothetical protein [Pseudomonas aeruginosa]HEK1459437.1 hypothetical protein [Pseudomonas aeruginosa]
MHSYQHNVSGFYLRRVRAEATLAQLLRRGLPREQLRIIAANSNGPATSWPAGRHSARLNNLLIYGTYGMAIGFVLGLLLEMLLLGDSSPWNTGLPFSSAVRLGGVALAGAILGTMVGVAILGQANWASDEGDVLLVAQTHSARETSIAHEVMRASAELCSDTDVRDDRHG